jgi:hypothetical protein
MNPRALLVLALVAACGGEQPVDDDDDVPVDATVDATVIDTPYPDAFEGQFIWERVSFAAGSAPVSMDPVAVTTGRTTRVMISGTIEADEIAMTVVTYDEVNRRAYAPIAGLRRFPPSLRGGAIQVSRPVLLRFPTTGTWTVYAGPDTAAPSLTIEVGAAPVRDCGTGVGCELDCDCQLTNPGERCLGGYGIGGPFLACAKPCELDRDCGGDGTCDSADDGLDSVCYDTGAECSATAPCADGFVCNAGACVATFQLSSQNRIACDDGYDCTPPLRCIIDADGEGSRCEMACPTDGPWCDGQHFCGTLFQDVSGLAQVDGVCGWVGD